jgi:hypothetical protein
MWDRFLSQVHQSWLSNAMSKMQSRNISSLACSAPTGGRPLEQLGLNGIVRNFV